MIGDNPKKMMNALADLTGNKWHENTRTGEKPPEGLRVFTVFGRSYLTKGQPRIWVNTYMGSNLAWRYLYDDCITHWLMMDKPHSKKWKLWKNDDS